MNKIEMAALLAEQTGMTKAVAARFLDTTLDLISSSLKDGKSVVLINFGTFEVKQRAAREGRNPQTGEKITIKATKVVSFKPGKALKTAVSES